MRELAAARRARAGREAAGGDGRRGARADRRGVRARGRARRGRPRRALQPRAARAAPRASQDGQLGDVFLIATERVGPFPDRVRDVGVVKDLATHDLDLVRWLGGAPVERGRGADRSTAWAATHEDLVLVTGRLRERRARSTASSTGCRRRRSAARAMLGERGMLVADTLTADLTFYENGAGQLGVGGAAVAARRQRGRHDALRAARAASRCWSSWRRSATSSRGDDGAAVVTLEEGLETRRAAPRRCWRSAAAARRSRRVPGRSREGAVVVALGKIGLPLAAQIARAGHDGRRLRRRRARRRAGQRGRAPFPGEAGLDEALARGRRRGPPARADRHGRGGRRGRRPRGRRRRRWSSTRDAQPDWADPRRRRRATSAAGCRPGTHGRAIETTLPVGTTRDARRAGARGGAAGCAAARTSTSSSAPSASTAAASSRTSRTYPKLVGGLTRGGRGARRRAVRAVPRDAEVPAAMGSAPRPPSWRSSPRRPTATSTSRFANELARHADALGVDVDAVIDAANTQPFSHIHRPGRRGRRALHPGLPALLPRGRPRRAPARGGARGQRRDAGLRGRRCSPTRSATSPAAAC